MQRVLMLAAALCALAVPLLAAASPVWAAASGNPFSGAKLFVDPEAAAARQVQAWRHSRPGDARLVEKIAGQPAAEWLGPWFRDVGATVRDRIASSLRPRHATAFFALYNIPHRDCGGYSGGGAGSASGYKRWVDRVAQAIGSYPAIILVEPDALAQVACLSSGRRRERIALERYATARLSSLRHTSVYIDVGSASWNRARELVGLLRSAGVSRARGFALGTTSYDRTEDNLRYGHRIGAALHGKHFIVNTSRNGRGPLTRARSSRSEDSWCNPPQRGLGVRPTAFTADRLADAYAWTSHPGFSDGPCNGGPASGTWWPEYALGLARRAAF